MSKFPIKRIRTLALVGQAGSGKTSLAEALLARAKAIPAAGSIERGSTVCDYTALEKSFRHSLKLAVASFDVKENGADHRVHLLDTPAIRISSDMRCPRWRRSRPPRSSSTRRTASR
jgi:elongation factor G